MRNDKHLAIKLRKLGESYNKISEELEIPKSTISDWLSDVKWSQKIRDRLAKKTSHKAGNKLRTFNKKRWEKWRESFRCEARKEFSNLINNPLFVAGINLYWGEGDSKLKNGQVRLGNVDPRMISLFVKFLLNIAKVPREKITIWLLLYPDLSEKKCKIFWSKITGLLFNQFGKSQIISGRHPTKRIEYGVCTILVCSRGLKEKIVTWINLFYNHIDNLRV